MKLKTLKPKLGTIDTNRVPTLRDGGWRTSKTTTGERGYNYRWQKARLAHLRDNPLCVMCKEQDNRVAVATVVDHKIPHRGDMVLFWDETNWQSLCASHHSSDKQREEKSGTQRTRFDADGKVIW